ncbi:MAG: response regulator [Bacteroidales bacterium]|nr:response regulator [Bacteroidales bacterium]
MKRVLVVEDNRLERKIILHMLEAAFGSLLRTDEVADGSQALKYLEKQEYDLVITDLIMPNTEGLELIRVINKKYPHSEIIAISGSNPYYLYLAKKLGISGFFTKPLDKDLFLDSINNLLHLGVPRVAQV